MNDFQRSVRRSAALATPAVRLTATAARRAFTATSASYMVFMRLTSLAFASSTERISKSSNASFASFISSTTFLAFASVVLTCASTSRPNYTRLPYSGSAAPPPGSSCACFTDATRAAACSASAASCTSLANCTALPAVSRAYTRVRYSWTLTCALRATSSAVAVSRSSEAARSRSS